MLFIPDVPLGLSLFIPKLLFLSLLFLSREPQQNPLWSVDKPVEKASGRKEGVGRRNTGWTPEGLCGMGRLFGLQNFIIGMSHTEDNENES